MTKISMAAMGGRELRKYKLALHTKVTKASKEGIRVQRISRLSEPVISGGL
jgi:hypothetical protein